MYQKVVLGHLWQSLFIQESYKIGEVNYSYLQLGYENILVLGIGRLYCVFLWDFLCV